MAYTLLRTCFQDRDCELGFIKTPAFLLPCVRVGIKLAWLPRTANVMCFNPSSITQISVALLKYCKRTTRVLQRSLSGSRLSAGVLCLDPGCQLFFFWSGSRLSAGVLCLDRDCQLGFFV